MNITRIYLVENCYGDPNKIYIGKTKNSRKNNHKKTYGQNIIYTYIDEIDSLDKKYWKPLEQYWIEQFRQWGFKIMNKNKGGGGSSFWTEEQKSNINRKIKISQSNIGKHFLTQKQRNNIGNKNKNRKLTSEQIDKIVKAKLGKKRSKEHNLNFAKAKCKKIHQFDKQGNFIREWSSIKEAILIYNTGVMACLKGKYTHSGGFIWKYKKSKN